MHVSAREDAPVAAWNFDASTKLPHYGKTQKVAADADACTAIECEMSVLTIDCSPNQYCTNCEAKQFNLSNTLKVNLMCM